MYYDMLIAKYGCDSVGDADDGLPQKITDLSGNENDGAGVNVSRVGLRQSMDEPDIKTWLAFNGHSFAKIDSPMLGQDTFTIRCNFFIYRLDRTQYIFDKRHGQWHRNYCFVYFHARSEHLRKEMFGTPWLLFDIGDGSRMSDDFDNGIAMPIHGIENLYDGDEENIRNRSLYIEIIVHYDGWELGLLVCASNKEGAHYDSRIIPFGNSIKGNGPLIIGSAGVPHTRLWPVFGTSFFYGAIKTFEIYDDVRLIKGDMI